MIARYLRRRFSGAAFRRSFAALRIVDYRRWSIAQFFSGAGGSASQVAMAWLVVELGGNGIALGAVTASMMLPTLLLGPVVGLLVDRYARRTVLLVTGTVQLLIAAALAALAFSGTVRIWSLLVLSLVSGLAFAADNPARQLLVLDIVGREQVTSAVSMNEVAINSARIVGPAVAGVLLVFGSAAWCFAFNALSFVPALVVLLTLHPRATAGEPGNARHDEPATVVPALATSAWPFAVRTASIRATLLLAVCAGAAFNIAVVIPLMVADVFHAGGGVYGALALGFGLGALPGAILSATGSNRPRPEEIRRLGLAMGVVVLLTAFAPTLPLLFAGLGVVGMAVMWFIARANAFVMLETPLAIRGRVMGIWAMAMPGTNVVTGLLIGTLADAADPRIAYGTIGLVTAILAVASWRALRPAT